MLCLTSTHHSDNFFQWKLILEAESRIRLNIYIYNNFVLDHETNNIKLFFIVCLYVQLTEFMWYLFRYTNIWLILTYFPNLLACLWYYFNEESLLFLFNSSGMSNSANQWAAAHQASFTISWSFLKLISIESVMPSNHLVLYCPLLLLPSIFLS